MHEWQKVIVTIVTATVFMWLICTGQANALDVREIDCNRLQSTVVTETVDCKNVEPASATTVDTTKRVIRTANTLPRTVANTDNTITLPGFIRQLVERIAREIGINPRLAAAVAHAESGGNQRAVSRAGAVGVMQLMPGTARNLGVNPYSLEENIRGGCLYLKQLLHRYNNNTLLALAAYNAGPGAVEKYGGVPPYGETRNYITRVMSRLGE